MYNARMTRHLDPAEREFFTLVSRAAFSNPFGRERDELDQVIAETGGDDPDLLDRLLQRIRARLDALDVGSSALLRNYGAQDRALLEHACFFECFHLFADDFDAHVEAQVRAGDTPVPAPFGPSLVERMSGRGIEPERARRALTIFFQMRRAWYFIGTGLTGRSACMVRLRESLWNNIFTFDIGLFERYLWNRLEDFSTILLGETGTGKGAAAAAIGRSGYIPWNGTRGTFAVSFTETFVPINLSQYPESLIESELFGHRKGAFTGAVDSHEGVFSRCSPNGSIFLDEIGEVSVPVQIKLLQVLQERVFTPVGSHEPRRFEGRVIAATHRPLDALRAERRFRDDFYYRLCSDVIHVPPLRQRLAEAPRELDDLIAVMLPRMIGEPSEELGRMVRESILRDVGAGYGWPGNVRELEQCVRRVLLTRRCEPDGAHEGEDTEGRLLAGVRAGAFDARGLTSAYCALLYERLGTYEKVANVTGLDRRTVKKHVVEARAAREDR